MGIIKRILGICETKKPVNPGCWKHVDGRLEVDLGLAGELSLPGDAIRLEGGDLGREKILVIIGQDGEYRAYRNRCTHVGHRRIDPLHGEPLLRCCSVSKSTYDYQGRVVSGPANEPLTVLECEIVDERLVIKLDR